MKNISKKFRNKKAEGYVDSGVKILIAVVIGALLLGGMYMLMSDTIIPTAQEKVEALFDYSDGGVPGGVVADTFTFTIGGRTYEAEENMTWDEWCDSTYNTIGIFNDSGAIGGSKYVSYTEGVDESVSASSTIIPGYAYGWYDPWN